MAKSNFSLFRPQNKVFVPLYICKLKPSFLWGFLGSNGFLLAQWPFSPCWYRTLFPVHFDNVLPASVRIHTKSMAFTLESICTFWTKTRSSLGRRSCLLPGGCSHYVFTFMYLLVTFGTFKDLEVASKD